jgi:ATP-binding cassette subfamily B protein
MMTGEKAKDLRGSLKKLLGYLGAYRKQIAAVLIFAVGSTVFSIIGPKVLGRATNALATGIIAMARGTGEIDFAYIGRIVLWLLGLYLLSAVFGYLQSYIMAGVSNDVTYRLRRDISEKIDRLPLSSTLKARDRARCCQPHHQRRRRPQPEPQPEHRTQLITSRDHA